MVAQGLRGASPAPSPASRTGQVTAPQVTREPFAALPCSVPSRATSFTRRARWSVGPSGRPGRCRPDLRRARGLRAARPPEPPGGVVQIGKIGKGPFLILPIREMPLRPPRRGRVSSPGESHSPALDRHDTAAVWALRLHGEPGKPASITGAARSGSTIFSIVTPFLSGRTAAREDKEFRRIPIFPPVAEPANGRARPDSQGILIFPFRTTPRPSRRGRRGHRRTRRGHPPGAPFVAHRRLGDGERARKPRWAVAAKP